MKREDMREKKKKQMRWSGATAEITNLHATTLFSWHRRKATRLGSHNETTGPSLKSRGRKTKPNPTWLSAVVAPQRNAPCWTCFSSVSTFINNSPSTLGQESHSSLLHLAALFHCPGLALCKQDVLICIVWGGRGVQVIGNRPVRGNLNSTVLKRWARLNDVVCFHVFFLLQNCRDIQLGFKKLSAKNFNRKTNTAE